MIVDIAATEVKARQHTLNKLDDLTNPGQKALGVQIPSSCTCVGRGARTAMWSMVQIADLSASWAHGAGLLQSRR